MQLTLIATVSVGAVAFLPAVIAGALIGVTVAGALYIHLNQLA